MKFKLPSFRACLLACVARVCGNGSDQQPPQSYVNRPMFRPAPKRVKPVKFVASDRFHSNQRQRRKDARLANAAGVRNAFS
jgi:hypothetical protein